MLQLPLPILEWKWDNVVMDFVMGLLRTTRGYDAIWMIVNHLTKSAHFLPIKKTYPLNRFARIYIEEIVKLHGVPVSIVLIEIPVLLLIFGELCMRHWDLS